MPYLVKVENASSDESIVPFALRLGPELVIQDLCYRPKAVLWKDRRREPGLVEGFGSRLRVTLSQK